MERYCGVLLSEELKDLPEDGRIIKFDLNSIMIECCREFREYQIDGAIIESDGEPGARALILCLRIKKPD